MVAQAGQSAERLVAPAAAHRQRVRQPLRRRQLHHLCVGPQHINCVRACSHALKSRGCDVYRARCSQQVHEASAMLLCKALCPLACRCLSAASTPGGAATLGALGAWAHSLPSFRSEAYCSSKWRVHNEEGEQFVLRLIRNVTHLLSRERPVREGLPAIPSFLHEAYTSRLAWWVSPEACDTLGFGCDSLLRSRTCSSTTMMLLASEMRSRSSVLAASVCCGKGARQRGHRGRSPVQAARAWTARRQSPQPLWPAKRGCVGKVPAEAAASICRTSRGQSQLTDTHRNPPHGSDTGPP
jgi:hypothetical protein